MYPADKMLLYLFKSWEVFLIHQHCGIPEAVGSEGDSYSITAAFTVMSFFFNRYIIVLLTTKDTVILIVCYR